MPAKQPTTTKIDGLYWLLVTEADSRMSDYVCRYSDDELEECFNANERLALQSGLSVVTANGTTWTNMVDAARAARRAIAPRRCPAPVAKRKAR